MHIFVDRHVFDSSDALATGTQNFSRNVVTERRREVLWWGRKFFVLPERNICHACYGNGENAMPLDELAQKKSFL